MIKGALYICDFCGKNQNEVTHIIAGDRGCGICNECIMISAKILYEIERGDAEYDSWLTALRK